MIKIRYPKINTLWKRNEETHKIIEGDFSREEFNAIKFWRLTEKVDGMNIRIEFQTKHEPLYDGTLWKTQSVNFFGKTDDAQIPKMLQEYLEKTFTIDKLRKQFPDAQHVILFGEGYGNKIQSVGKKYRKDNSFILFDVWIDGWWLELDNVKDIAKSLKIDCIPDLGQYNVEGILFYLKCEPRSKVNPDVLMEGFVATSYPMMMFRDGTPIKFKIKARDYR